MSFDVKITATAAILLGLALFLHAPAAHAESGTIVKATSTTVVTPKTTLKTVVVKPGDNLSTIATKYHTTWVRLYDANKGVIDPDLIHPGEKIKVPTEDQKLPDRYDSYVADQAPVTTTATAVSVPTTINGQSFAGASVVSGNAYDWGQCTWYVKNRRPDVGSYWGNAGYNWISEAQAAGFATGSTPRPGAVAVEAGHVAYVESVSGNSVRVSEMNWNGGVGVVSYRTTSASEFQYIY